MVEAHGFVPNGLRTYYLNRSQPPLLSQARGAARGVACGVGWQDGAAASLQECHLCLPQPFLPAACRVLPAGLGPQYGH